MEQKSIPWAKPHLWGDEAGYLQKAIASTWISGGPFVEALEERLKYYLQTPYGLAVSNGTTAIHLAYLALGIGRDDEVILPGYGFLAAANMTLHVGAQPVFCDVDDRSWVVTAQNIEPCITPRTKAIVAIHTYGNISPMDEIMELACYHGIPVIEDAAEAFGGQYKYCNAGTIGDIGTFSFQATKTITTGEGGFVTTRNSALCEKMALYRSHGMQRKIPYWHDVPGHNFRLTNLQAALGLAQLGHIEAIKKKREHIYQSYLRELVNIDGVECQHFPKHVEPLIWAMAVMLDPSAFPQGRDSVISAMAQQKIETRPGFYTPDQHVYFDAPALANSAQISRNVLCLPMFVDLDEQQIHTITRTLAGLRS